jgi:hypothetical protein
MKSGNTHQHTHKRKKKMIKKFEKEKQRRRRRRRRRNNSKDLSCARFQSAVSPYPSPLLRSIYYGFVGRQAQENANQKVKINRKNEIEIIHSLILCVFLIYIVK